MADIDAPDLRPFIMLYTDVLKDIGDPTAIALYCALLSYANREKLCHPSLKKLAKDIGLSGESTKTVRRAIDILESKGYVVAFRRWRNQDNDVSTTQDDEFSIPTSNGYHVYTTLGGVANSPQGYGLKTPRGRGQQPLGVGANNPSNYNHMNYNQVELDSSDAKTSKGVVAQKEPPREDIDQLCTLIKDHAASQSTAKPPSISQEWRRQARLLLDKDGVPLDQAVKVLTWAANDPFWASNILSMPKFRKQFRQLEAKMASSSSPARRQPVSEIAGYFEAGERLKAKFAGGGGDGWG